MVIINDCVLNVLNRIYLDSIAHKGYAPDLYFEAIDLSYGRLGIVAGVGNGRGVDKMQMKLGGGV